MPYVWGQLGTGPGEFDLTEDRYGDCHADVVNLLDRGSVWVGQGDNACLVTDAGYETRIAPSALNNTICRETVSLPRVLLDDGQYFAIAHENLPAEAGRRAPTRTLYVPVAQHGSR